MSETPNITLRPATAGDREILLAVYAASRAIELSMVPWDEEQKRTFVVHQFDAQTDYYTKTFPAATHDVIEADGEPAGRLYVDRRNDEIAILDITVLPPFRRRGIGTHLIRNLQNEAAERIVSVFVEGFNPSLQLFEKLGFTAVSNDDVNLRLEWRSGPGSSPASSR